MLSHHFSGAGAEGGISATAGHPQSQYREREQSSVRDARTEKLKIAEVSHPIHNMEHIVEVLRFGGTSANLQPNKETQYP